MRPVFKLPTDQGDSGAWGPKLNAALEAAMAPGLPAFGGLRPVGYHGGIPGNNQSGLSNGTDRVSHTVSRHPLALGTITSITLVFPGCWYLDGLTGELDLPNLATTSAILELANGTRLPVYFRGLRKVTPDIGSAYVVSDPIPVLIRPADARYVLVRTRVEVPAGGKFASNITVNNTHFPGEGHLRGTDESVDLLASGSIGTVAGYGNGPMMVLGSNALISQPIVGVEGDSIGNGSADQVNDWGFLSRCVRALGVPEVKTANGGGSNADSLLPASWRRRALQIGVTHVIHEGGVNDTRGGLLTLAQLQAQDIAKWRRSADEGARVMVTTMTPTGTSSTDAYATSTNQTILNATAQTVRVGRNNWIRAGAPLNPTTFAPMTAGANGAVTFGQAGHPAKTFLEVADLVESARDSGVFAGGYTSDGLHISASRQIAMAPLITAAVQAFLEMT